MERRKEGAREKQKGLRKEIKKHKQWRIYIRTLEKGGKEKMHDDLERGRERAEDIVGGRKREQTNVRERA